MKLTWLGQQGVALESQGSLLMVDPYLLDTMRTTVGEEFGRLVPVDEKWLEARPDMVLLTHDHIDHLDLPSLKAVISNEKMISIASGVNAWNKVRTEIGGPHNYIMMTPGCEWTNEVFRVRAINARHSDQTGVGFVVEAEGLKIVISGDTLYFADAANEIGVGTDIAVVVMNGKGNNMNCVDAARYCENISAKVAIPTHWGLFKKFENDPDQPERFVEETKKRGVKAAVLSIYESVDTDTLLEGV